MTESNNLDVSKKLSQQLETKIEKVNQKYAKTKDEIKAEIIDIYNSAIAEGFTPMQARRICEERIDIFSDRTIRRWLPTEATRSYSPRAIGQMSNSKKPQNPNNEEPELEFVVEKVDEYIANVPREPEPEPPAPAGDRKVRLDTAKFRSDLRIALINGDKIWLTCNSANEVTKISE
jgi:uncharacterized protein (UPF0335 family)